MAATVIVAVTGLWPATQAAILVLLAVGGLFIVVVHDLLPSFAARLVALRARGRGRAARRLAAGRADRRRLSPFFFAFR